MENRNILVHTHIFKNAGSSFDDALQRNFRDSFIDHRDDHLIHKDKSFLNKYISKNKNVKAFSSHSIYDKPTNFENVVYHTAYFIRHPIDRIKSVYSFENKQPAEDSLGAKMAKKFDFKEYVNWRMQPDVPPTIRNLQTVFVAGRGKGTGRMEMRYELALKTLEESPLIALVDRYDESMVVFEDYLCKFFPDIDLSYIRRNVTDKVQALSPEEKAQKLLNDLGEELAEKVIENNKYDIELYKKANELLDKRIKDIVSFDKKLENFQQRCSQLKERRKVDIKPLYKNIKKTIMNSIGTKEKDLKKKKNIILHIGRHKSGTSSLQKFLCDNEKGLKEKGFYYPKSLRRKIAHHPLAYFYNDNLKSNLSSDDINEIKEFWDEIEDKNNIIISSEAFQNINPNNLKKDFENYNLTIVVYLRDQVSYLLSSYAQAIQNQKLTKTLEEYESTNFKDIDYLKFLKKWKSALPSAKLIVRLFDKEILYNEDIRKDFIINCNICNNLELNNFNFENKDQNPSIGGVLLEFKRLLNYSNFDKYIKTNKIYEILGKLALGNEKYKLQKLIKKDIYDKVIAKYNKSNQKVSKLYLKGQDIVMQKVNYSDLNSPLTNTERSEILKLFSKFGIDLNKFKIETTNHILENTPGLEKIFSNHNTNNEYGEQKKLFLDSFDIGSKYLNKYFFTFGEYEYLADSYWPSNNKISYDELDKYVFSNNPDITYIFFETMLVSKNRKELKSIIKRKNKVDDIKSSIKFIQEKTYSKSLFEINLSELITQISHKEDHILKEEFKISIQHNNKKIMDFSSDKSIFYAKINHGYWEYTRTVYDKEKRDNSYYRNIDLELNSQRWIYSELSKYWAFQLSQYLKHNQNLQNQNFLCLGLSNGMKTNEEILNNQLSNVSRGAVVGSLSFIQIIEKNNKPISVGDGTDIKDLIIEGNLNLFDNKYIQSSEACIFLVPPHLKNISLKNYNGRIYKFLVPGTKIHETWKVVCSTFLGYVIKLMKEHKTITILAQGGAVASLMALIYSEIDFIPKDNKIYFFDFGRILDLVNQDDENNHQWKKDLSDENNEHFDNIFCLNEENISLMTTII